MKRKTPTFPQPAPPACGEVALDAFRTFFMCKAFDVIGQGTYKPYIIKCKENNDQWAIDAHRSINTVLDCLKRILALLHKIQSLPNVALSNVCKETVGNTTPPSASASEWGVCHISGEHSKDCVRLHRGGARGNDIVHIHEKYFRFIKLLWYATKIEHVVRSITRFWLEQNSDGVADMSMAERCRHFEQHFRDTDKHFTFFSYATHYVEESFESYIQHYVFDVPLELELGDGVPLKKKRRDK